MLLAVVVVLLVRLQLLVNGNSETMVLMPHNNSLKPDLIGAHSHEKWSVSGNYDQVERDPNAHGMAKDDASLLILLLGVFTFHWDYYYY